MNSSKPEDWNDRRPKAGETCVFTGGYNGSPNQPAWKRDALLFDRVYARCKNLDNPPDIPFQVSFGIEAFDNQVDIANAAAAWAISEGGSPNEFPPDELNWDKKLTAQYYQTGIMGVWTYKAGELYFQRFSEGNCMAYEGALNNLPIISTQDAQWDQIIAFREDPESVRKYRDLRIWLRSCLNAQSVEHATDIIGQKIDDYRWAIKKHGFQTTLGAITQIFDWKESRLPLAAGGLAAILGGPLWAAIASGLAVTSKIGAWVCEKKISSEEILRGPDREIAILYDIQEQFGKQIDKKNLPPSP